MNSRNFNPFLRAKIIHCVLLFITIFIVGTGLVIADAIKAAYDTNQLRISIATKVLNEEITNAEKALQVIKPFHDKPCAETQAQISKILVENPNIQTINMLKNDVVTCSNFNPIIGKSRSLVDKNEISLVNSIFLSPGKPLLLIKDVIDNTTIAVTLHYFSFSGIFNLLEDNSTFYLSTNSAWVSGNKVNFIQKDQDDIVENSTEHAFSVSAKLNYANIVNNALHNNLTLLFLIGIASLATYYYAKFHHYNVIKYALKRSIKKKDIIPYIQTISDHQGQIVGGEILMRWKYRSNVLSPYHFIDIAEESGLIVPMTLQLFDDLYQTCINSIDNIKQDFYLSINISAKQLAKEHRDDLIAKCQLFLANPKLKHITLVLEITERQIISNNQENLKTIHALNSLGITLALDDFGTGYSSLENIHSFNVGIIKIDKSFIDHIESSPLGCNLIANIIDLSERLKLKTVAEGVENKEQAKYLITNGINLLQGYLYHKPQCFSAFIQHQNKAA